MAVFQIRSGLILADFIWFNAEKGGQLRRTEEGRQGSLITQKVLLIFFFFPFEYYINSEWKKPQKSSGTVSVFYRQDDTVSNLQRRCKSIIIHILEIWDLVEKTVWKVKKKKRILFRICHRKGKLGGRLKKSQLKYFRAEVSGAQILHIRIASTQAIVTQSLSHV